MKQGSKRNASAWNRRSMLIVSSLIFQAVTSPVYADATPPIPQGAISSLDDIHAEQAKLNKDLPLKLDDQTTLLRIDFKKGVWNYHIAVVYWIYRAQEFAEKRHATMINKLCMDPNFVQYLKSSGPFLYQFTDPSGQVANVAFPKDDCGE